MNEPGKKLDRWVFFAMSIVLTLLLAFAGYRAIRRNAALLIGDFFYPYLALNRVVTHSVAEQSLWLFSRAELISKSETLQQENNQLKTEKLHLETLAEENQTLRELAQLPPPAKWRYYTVQILLRDPLFWREKFTVEINPEMKITPGAAVVTPTSTGVPALVGVISFVGKRHAEVETICSAKLRVSVSFPKGGNGFLNAGERKAAAGTIPVGYIPVNRQVAAGDSALTTGFTATIPPGLLVGKLTTLDEVDQNFSSALHVSGLLTPEVDFDNLRFMLIATPETGDDRGANP
ncbi:MAG: rod shape-determining protein MreC [Victivallales bacterium]|jgi:cell shape-determining protein MreC|nr:rod shape-determining protein MreC [Victivallales bacterium]